MLHPFFAFFERNRPKIDPDPVNWPQHWKTVQWKSYPRSPIIPLPRVSPGSTTLASAIETRRSRNDFGSGEFTEEAIGALLLYGCGITRPSDAADASRRAQPSGGALYPIEVYPILLRDAGAIQAGYYHYDVRHHALEVVRSGSVTELPTAFFYPWVADATMVLLFSFIERRSKPKYGNLAYKVGLIESGHIGQNVYLVATALGLRCCALGSMDYGKVHKLLGIDGATEVIFYAIAVGSI